MNWTEIGAGGAAGAIVAWLANLWLSARLRTELEKEMEAFKLQIRAREFVERTKWETKHQASLDALKVVDAVFSNQTWNIPNVNVVKQPVSTAIARECYNNLAISCDDPNLVTVFAKTLGLREPKDPPSSITADMIIDLRNAIRKELGFGAPIATDRNLAWIVSLTGEPKG